VTKLYPQPAPLGYHDGRHFQSVTAVGVKYIVPLNGDAAETLLSCPRHLTEQVRRLVALIMQP
jgi:hypothetical protein